MFLALKSYRIYMSLAAIFGWFKGRFSMDSNDNSYRFAPRTAVLTRQESLFGAGGRVVCLAIGGFVIVNIALALLHLT